ncbi:hypothetical protein MCOR13_011886 [Pyricularia oryzae]|nr:hypothetical protein MCOR13_011886 [Pyricularia oryzae]
MARAISRLVEVIHLFSVYINDLSFPRFNPQLLSSSTSLLSTFIDNRSHAQFFLIINHLHFSLSRLLVINFLRARLQIVTMSLVPAGPAVSTVDSIAGPIVVRRTRDEIWITLPTASAGNRAFFRHLAINVSIPWLSFLVARSG